MDKKKKSQLIMPFFGEVAVAKQFFFILPDKKDFLPEMTAYLKASAIKIGFFANAIAEFTKTP